MGLAYPMFNINPSLCKQLHAHFSAPLYREPSIRAARGILWSSRLNYAVPRQVKVWIVKCSPRTDSESFSSSREQACVNTGWDKVLIYPRVWRTRISLKCLLFQEWLTVKRKRSRLLHKISLGVKCKREWRRVADQSSGIINSKGLFLPLW